MKIHELKTGEVYTSDYIRYENRDTDTFMIILYGGSDIKRVNTLLDLAGKLQKNISFGAETSNFTLSTNEEKTKLRDALIKNGDIQLAEKIFITPQIYELW
jgi:hypothetical protein